MALKLTLENTPITLPLDVVLTLARAAKGQLSDDVQGLLRVEVASSLSRVKGIEEEVFRAVMRDTFA